MAFPVEDQTVRARIRHLSTAPAAVRFLSLEPLLAPLGTLDLEAVSWVIVGGESGPRARPMQPEWVRQIRDQCQAADVPFFFKQWGGRIPKAGGRRLDSMEYDGMPLLPEVLAEGNRGVLMDHDSRRDEINLDLIAPLSKHVVG